MIAIKNTIIDDIFEMELLLINGLPKYRMLTYKVVGGRGGATRSLPSDKDVEELSYIYETVRSCTKVLTRNQK